MLCKTLALLAIAFFATTAASDTVTLVGGGKLECTVLQENPADTVVLYGSGVLNLGKGTVQSIERAQKGHLNNRFGVRHDCL